MLGGGEHSFLEFLSYLPNTWEVLAVVPGKGELETRLKLGEIETRVAHLHPIRPWYLYYILRSLKIYFNLCRSYRPVLIYANGSRAAFYGGIVGRILKIPVIWHCRITNPDPYLDPILKRLSLMIIANSQATSKRFKEPFKSKVRIVHNGVDIKKMRDNSSPQPSLIGNTWKVILVVARISKWKRHDLALTAFEKVAINEPNAHLVCIGSKDEFEADWWKYLQSRTIQSMFSDRIHWIGQVSDVRPWYRAASLLLLCSENEPFGRVIVEAMVCGVPVIATNSGGVPEIVRHGEDGLLVTPGSADEMADTMTAILGNEALRGRLAQSAIRRAQSFDLDTHTNKMMKAFEKTVKT